MSKNYESKAAIISEIKENFQNCQSAVIVDYRGLTVEEDTALRKELREAGVVYKVLKNTYIKRASDEIGLEGFKDELNGPTAVAFSMNDPASAARILKKFMADKKMMSVKCGVLEGKVIDAKTVDMLAELPTREGLLSMLLGCLVGNLRNLLYVLNSVADQKGEAA